MEKIERIENFINHIIIKELGLLQGIGADYVSFVAMGQAIEVLGSLLDNKPMKAKGQSGKRFDSCVNYLMGGKYRLYNQNHFLYDKLRNQMVHTFVPSSDIELLSEKSNVNRYEHLSMQQGKLIFISERMYEDICTAADRLCMLLRNGKVKAKNMSYE